MLTLKIDMPVILPAKDGFIWELKKPTVLDRQGKAKQTIDESERKNKGEMCFF